MGIELLEKKFDPPCHETVGKTARTKTEVVKKQLDYCYPGQLLIGPPCKKFAQPWSRLTGSHQVA